MKDILGLFLLPFALVLVILGIIGTMGSMIFDMLIDYLQGDSHCRQKEWKGGIKMQNENIKITTPNEPKSVTISTPNKPTHVTVETAFHPNSKCPSCDCGICNTFPTPYEVQCGGEETNSCKWLNYDFSSYQYQEESNNADR